MPLAIDFHTHAFPDELAPRAIGTINAGVPRDARAVLNGTLDDLLRSMDGAGVERSVICSIATAPKQAASILRWSASIASDRIIPFASVHPESTDPAGDVRRAADAGLRGVKLHPMYQGFCADEARVRPVYEAVAEAGLILILHAGCDIAFAPEDDRAAPERILAVHRAFPGMPLVAAHMGGWRAWREVARTLAGTGVYLETSYSFGMGADDQLGGIVERHDPQRILFGTDSPWRDQQRELDLVTSAFGGAEEAAGVLGGNARRLLGLGAAGG
jgi:predicted TIM-barrel fold metal-dependent hydrolase